jgi:hypothetical protein
MQMCNASPAVTFGGLTGEVAYADDAFDVDPDIQEISTAVLLRDSEALPPTLDDNPRLGPQARTRGSGFRPTDRPRRTLILTWSAFGFRTIMRAMRNKLPNANRRVYSAKN